MKNIKVIVFDLYNTLVEITSNNRFFNKLYKESVTGFDLDISSYLHLVMTKNEDELFKILPNEFLKSFTDNQHVLNEELNSVIVFNDVLKSLSELKENYKLFLISNLAFPYKKPVYNLGLDHFFEDMIFSCDFGYVKPNEKIFQEIERITQVQPEQILMIGDSLKSDIEGANKVG